MNPKALWIAIAGEFSWNRPGWIRRLGLRRLAVMMCVCMGLIALTLVGYWYLESRPKPLQIDFQIIPPDISEIVDEKLVPQPLQIEFYYLPNPDVVVPNNLSAARIDLAGEVVPTGIELEPAIAGEWRFETENRLSFLPQDDWPAGQHYRLRLSSDIFGSHLNLVNYDGDFSTPQFSAVLSSAEFYQDPVQANERRVVASFDFSHPVDRNSLQQQLRLSMRESGEDVTTAPRILEFKVEYGLHDRSAHVHSEIIAIPERENFVSVSVEPGLAAARGSHERIESVASQVLIPDRASYFRVREVKATIARDDNDNPIQTVVVDFTDRVNTKDFEQYLELFLLPEYRKVDNSSRVYHWRTPREVTIEVLRRAEHLQFSINPTERDAAALQSVSIDIPEGRSLYLRMRGGLRSVGGFVMSGTYDSVLRVPGYPKQANILQDGALLPLSGQKQLTFASRGVSTLRVDIHQVLAGEVNHLASQTGGDIRDPYFSNYNFNADNISSLTTQYIDVNPSHPREQVFATLDLGALVEDGGLFFVAVRGWDRKGEFYIGSADKRFVLVTDLGFLVKTNADHSSDLFVHSVTSGEPVAGASIALLGKNGVPVFTQTTDSDGHAQLPAANTFKRDRTATAFLVRLGSDVTFMPYQRRDRQLTYSGFDVGGDYVSVSEDAEQLRSALYSDRGIYRPGEKVQIFGILRRQDFTAVPGMPLELRIMDSRRVMVLRRRFEASEDGFHSWSYESRTESATGRYQVNLFLVDDKNRLKALGSTAFSIEEFQPDNMRIHTRINAPSGQAWIQPGTHTARVSLENLFGAPAQGRRVRGALQLTPAAFRFDDYAGFVFIDPFRKPDAVVKPVTMQLEEVVTDSAGVANLQFDVGQYDLGIYRLLLTAEGFEPGAGRSVKALASVLMSPLETIVGFKADGDLNYVSRDSERWLRFIAVGRDEQPASLNELEAVVFERRYVSALVKRPNGTFAYQSVLKETPVSRVSFPISAEGEDYQLPTGQPGRFVLKLINNENLTLSQVEFVVAGAQNLSANLERNAELDIKLDRNQYHPGDDITMEITAPYAGTGLITIERDQVYSFRWFRSSTNSTQQNIRVPADLEGNAYVNVAFIRDIDSEEVFVSPLSYAVAPFKIDRSRRRLGIDLDVPERVLPGQELVVGYETSNPARILLYAVDEGILQVADYKSPDPLDFFLRKKALQVRTWQISDLILPDYDVIRRAAAPGGGADIARLLGSNLNPFQRHTEAPVAFYSGLLDAQDQRREIRFRVPDYFNGQVRVMAVAASAQRLGSAQAMATVRGPFVLTPNLPTAVAPGDEFNVSVGIANNLENSGAGLPITLSLIPGDRLELLDNASQQISIDEGGEARVVFRVRAGASPGSMEFAVTAVAGDTKVRRGMSLSIRPAVPYMTTTQTGFSPDTRVELEVSRKLLPAFAEQHISASTSPLVLAQGMLEYLETFPHVCAEQLVSKVFPQVGLLKGNDFPIDRGKFTALFEQTLFKLRSLQHSDGGFRFWVSSTESATFPSVYIAHFMTDAREQGLAVPADMLNGVMGYLQQIAAKPADTLMDARIRAYAVYILTRNGVVTTNYLTSLQEGLQQRFANQWQEDITSVYMAAAFDLLKNDILASRLVDGYRMGNPTSADTDFDTRLGRDAQFVYLLARHFPERLDAVNGEALRSLMNPVFDNRFNTLSSAYTILALGEYHRQLSRRGAVVIPEVVAWGPDDMLPLDGPVAPLAQTSLPVDTQRVLVDLDTASDGFYYAMAQSGYDQALPMEPVAEGIQLTRVYLNDDGEEVDAATVGDDLTVRLRIRSLKGVLRNVAITDLLPGGFEIITESVRLDNAGWSCEYFDIREDRIVIYRGFSERMIELDYRVRLTSPGNFIVPSAYAEPMYNRDVHGRTAARRFLVKGVQ